MSASGSSVKLEPPPTFKSSPLNNFSRSKISYVISFGSSSNAILLRSDLRIGNSLTEVFSNKENLVLFIMLISSRGLLYNSSLL